MGSITKLQVKAFSHTLRLIKRSSCPAVHVLIGTVRQNSKYRSTPKLRRETQSVRMLPKYGSSGFLKKTHGIYYQTPCKSLQSYPKIDQKIIVSSRSCSDRNSSTKLQISIDAKTRAWNPMCQNAPEIWFFRIPKENPWDLAPNSM